jgi:uncharacterized protein (TIGR03067 family)
MRAFLMIAVLAVAVPDRPDPTPKQTPSLPEQMLGEWQLVKHVVAGNDVPELNGLLMVFGRESMQHVHLRNGMRQPGGTFPYTLDVNKNPAVIDFRSSKFIGIIKVEGDLLTICFARNGESQPPAEFVSQPSTSTTLLQATRLRK